MLHTGAEAYGGAGSALPETLNATDEPLHGRPHSVDLPLAGLSCVLLKPA
jgi:hypothetical protein